MEITTANVRQSLGCSRSNCPCQTHTGNVHCPLPGHGQGYGDRNPSVSLQEKNGKTVVSCKSGCEQKELWAAVLEALGVERDGGDDYRPPPTPISQAEAKQMERGIPRADEKIVAVYDYCIADGTRIAQKRRIENKNEGAKRFEWKAENGRWPILQPLKTLDLPLYRSQNLEGRPDEDVWFVEGEKSVEACEGQGLLAVCLAGSSSQSNYGEALNVLRGRRVQLWADNDDVGRKLMRRVRAALASIAARVTLVVPPVYLPPGGDAADYFADATLDALLDGQLLEPTIEPLEHDAYRIRWPTDIGAVAFTFTEMERGRRSLDARVRVNLLGVGGQGGENEYSQRLNLLSQSASTAFRRDLEGIWDGYEWKSIVPQAISRIEAEYSKRSRAVDVFDIEDGDTEMPFLIEGWLPKNLPSLLYASDGSMKSMLAEYIAICVAYGIDFFGHPVEQGNVIYVDYEADRDTFKRRLRRMMEGLDIIGQPQHIYYWNPYGEPLRDVVESLREDGEKVGAALVIVDSAGEACGGNAIDNDVTANYFRGLAKIGLTSLTISHIPKNQEHPNKVVDYPYGSMYWRALPRRTYYMRRTTRALQREQTGNMHDLGVFCTKSNDTAPDPLGLAVTFESAGGQITFETESVSDVPELEESLPTLDRAKAMFEVYGMQTLAELADQLGIYKKGDKRDLHDELRRNNWLFQEVKHDEGLDGCEWGLAADPQHRFDDDATEAS